MNPLSKGSSETIPTMLDCAPPLSLKQKPIFMFPYEHFDSLDAEKTDAKYLSIGLAQWRNDENPNPLSIKVWRYAADKKKWSRLSEELPPHRIVDMCIFLIKTLYMREEPPILFPAGTFENQQEDFAVKKLQNIPEGAEIELNIVKERLNKLREIINQANLD